MGLLAHVLLCTLQQRRAQPLDGLVEGLGTLARLLRHLMKFHPGLVGQMQQLLLTRIEFLQAFAKSETMRLQRVRLLQGFLREQIQNFIVEDQPVPRPSAAPPQSPSSKDNKTPTRWLTRSVSSSWTTSRRPAIT